eukprot:1160918-Pelagomonas_calceolata.AAC.5
MELANPTHKLNTASKLQWQRTCALTSILQVSISTACILLVRNLLNPASKRCGKEVAQMYTKFSWMHSNNDSKARGRQKLGIVEEKKEGMFSWI